MFNSYLRLFFMIFSFSFLPVWIYPIFAQSLDQEMAELKEQPTYTVFNDKMLLEGYRKKYQNLTKKILIEMIKDDNLTSYKAASAVHVFNTNFALEVVSREKRIIEKYLLRRLNRTSSPFVQVEIMHTLCRMDRYRYFKSLVPALIQKLNHYNATVTEMTFEYLMDLLDTEPTRSREARIVFNTLRKILFLSRKKIEFIDVPGPRLTKKLKLLRWSIKILGSPELKKLPKEVIHLL